MSEDESALIVITEILGGLATREDVAASVGKIKEASAAAAAELKQSLEKPGYAVALTQNMQMLRKDVLDALDNPGGEAEQRRDQQIAAILTELSKIRGSRGGQGTRRAVPLRKAIRRGVFAILLLVLLGAGGTIGAAVWFGGYGVVYAVVTNAERLVACQNTVEKLGRPAACSIIMQP